MKKVSIISVMAMALVLTLGLGAKAQRGDILAGGGLAFATDISKPGIFLHGTYKITPEWEGAADFTYFFPKKWEGAVLGGTSTIKTNWSALNFNAHYVFYNEGGIEAYGLGGISVQMVSVKTDVPAYSYMGYTSPATSGKVSDSNFGLNLGGGGRYQISDDLYGMAELKYCIVTGGYLQISAGVLYKF